MAASNAAAIRKAVKRLDDAIWTDPEGNVNIDMGEDAIHQILRTALAAPPRNCDVGSAHAQSRRFKAYCDEHGSGRYRDGSLKCDGCPLLKRVMKTGEICEMLWGQMPYKKEKRK